MDGPAPDVSILLVSGSVRRGSTNAAVLATVGAAPPAGVRTTTYGGLATLPHFNPDDDAEGAAPHPAVADLRAALRAHDALLVCTPEYAGALPGALKNLLEWTIGDASIHEKPVAWINAAGPAAPTGARDAHASLATVLRWASADVVDAACRRVPVSRGDIGEDGTVSGDERRAAIGGAAEALAAHVRAARTSG